MRRNVAFGSELQARRSRAVAGTDRADYRGIGATGSIAFWISLAIGIVALIFISALVFVNAVRRGNRRFKWGRSPRPAAKL